MTNQTLPESIVNAAKNVAETALKTYVIERQIAQQIKGKLDKKDPSCKCQVFVGREYTLLVKAKAHCSFTIDDVRMLVFA